MYYGLMYSVAEFVCANIGRAVVIRGSDLAMRAVGFETYPVRIDPDHVVIETWDADITSLRIDTGTVGFDTASLAIDEVSIDTLGSGIFDPGSATAGAGILTTGSGIFDPGSTTLRSGMLATGSGILTLGSGITVDLGPRIRAVGFGIDTIGFDCGCLGFGIGTASVDTVVGVDTFGIDIGSVGIGRFDDVDDVDDDIGLDRQVAKALMAPGTPMKSVCSFENVGETGNF